MATPEEMAHSMINNLGEKTGKDLGQWLKIVNSSGLVKHGEIVKYLKSDQGMTHGYANLISLKFKEQKEGGPPLESDLITMQYKGKDALKPIYDKIIGIVSKFGGDVEIAPKKAYVSLRRNKQFALIQPSTKTRVDVGINIKEQAPGGRLEASGSFNAMVSHRVKITDITEVNDDLEHWLLTAYQES